MKILLKIAGIFNRVYWAIKKSPASQLNKTCQIESPEPREHQKQKNCIIFGGKCLGIHLHVTFRHPQQLICHLSWCHRVGWLNERNLSRGGVPTLIFSNTHVHKVKCKLWIIIFGYYFPFQILIYFWLNILWNIYRDYSHIMYRNISDFQTPSHRIIYLFCME